MAEYVLIAGAIAGIAAAGVSMYSTMQQVKVQEEASQRQMQDLAQQMADESFVKEAEAASIEESAAFEERQYRRQAGLAIAKNRALGAAVGVDVSSGSPLILELDNIRQAELAAQNIRRTGELGAAGRRLEGALVRQRGGVLSGRLMADYGNIRSQGNLALVGQGIQGASSVLSSWSSYKYASRPRTTSYDTGV